MYEQCFGGLRTWIEIEVQAAENNYKIFRKLIGPKVKLWAVVKSNAYGHGLTQFAKIINSKIDGFCVDSITEGLRLREEGIAKPILVLGPTLPGLFRDAASADLILSISTFEELKALRVLKNPAQFHIKIDTGMHRRGFQSKDIPRLLNFLANCKLEIKNSLQGLFTHFASAKDINYPTYTEQQFKEFQKIITLFERAGFRNLITHCAATGGTIIDKKYHCDAMRVGIGLYGIWPSKELEVQMDNVALEPVLSWRTIITEIKTLQKGDYVGYDLAERVRRPTKIAILPIGYWHGFPRTLSSIGEVLIHGKRAKVLGRVSMDMTVVDVTGIACKPYDQATIIGRDGKDRITIAEIAEKISMSPYELVTRLNPLIERRIIYTKMYGARRDRNHRTSPQPA